MIRVLIPLTEGFEESEAIVPADLLIRSGIEAVFVGLKEKTVKGSHGIAVVCNGGSWEEAQPNPDDFQALFLPGGMPAAIHLSESAELKQFTEAMVAAGKTVAAICASPAVVLAEWGLLRGKIACCYPGFEPKLREGGAQPWENGPCIADGSFLTGRGAGAAFDFGLALVAALKDEETAVRLKEQVVYR
ncbi:MAG: DJ-1 family glyoxalase III [Spirochaetia bacterium]|nr:DJ-1 family glyoxalase III [Spirochaetia bacterium]